MLTYTDLYSVKRMASLTFGTFQSELSKCHFGHAGPFWVILGNFGLSGLFFWAIWSILSPLGHLGFWAMLSHSEALCAFWAIWTIVDPLSQSGPPKVILDPMGHSGPLEPFWTPWANLDPLGHPVPHRPFWTPQAFLDPLGHPVLDRSQSLSTSYLRKRD